MAPKPTRKLQPKASTSAVVKPAKPTKKRANREEEETEETDKVASRVDSLGLGPKKLEFGSDGEEEEDVIEELDDDEEGGEGDAFPEVDFGESDEDDEEYASGEEDEDSSDFESLGEVDEEEEAALLAEIEAEDAAGFNSADDEEEEEDDGSDLDELIRRNTSKPNENGSTPGTSWDDQADLPKNYMARSRTVVSTITGTEKTQWDQEIDAGYGSDSSTEEVRFDSLPFGSSRKDQRWKGS